MRVLVACEESQEVCKAFRAKGHNAFSCDLQECSGGHPEWHIMCDCLPLLNGNCKFITMDGKEHSVNGKWDLLIAHPPCTYLSNAGARWLYAGGKINAERYKKGLDGKAFFMKFWNADCPRICIENPVPSSVYELPPYSQFVQPYEYGEPFTSRSAHREVTPKPMTRNTRERVERAGAQRAEVRHSPESPAPWRSNGVIWNVERV